jgi:hypothetical protein
MSMNQTRGERVQAKRLRERMESEQVRRRQAEQRVVDAHRNEPGPKFGYVLVPGDHEPKTPRVRRP